MLRGGNLRACARLRFDLFDSDTFAFAPILEYPHCAGAGVGLDASENDDAQGASKPALQLGISPPASPRLPSRQAVEKRDAAGDELMPRAWQSLFEVELTAGVVSLEQYGSRRGNGSEDDFANTLE
jgi:hypothetical protein